MILCPTCETLNPEGERRCVACKAPLDSPGATQRTVVEDANSRATARCSNGHPIDPSWTVCPYCARQSGAGSGAATKVESTGAPPDAKRGGSGRTTRLETATSRDPGSNSSRRTRLASEEVSARAATPPTIEVRPSSSSAAPASAPPSAGLRATRLEEPALKRPPGRGTVLGASDGRTAQAPAASETRRLVAALAAPDLRPGGAVFAIREGKNRIGSDHDSEVCLGEDPQVSGEHALLLFRGGTVHLADRMSTNGTSVNGEELVGTHSVVLRDRDRIRCGSTELLFLVVEDLSDNPEGEDGSGEAESSDRS